MSKFTTREMLAALELRAPMRSFFTGFFPTMNTHVAEILELEIKKGKRVMAPFVAPRKGGKVITREGYSTKLLKTPKIAPERVTTVDDINQKGFGENIYSNKTPAQRSTELLAKDMNELEEYIQRRKEWMARQIILDGSITVQDKDEGVDVQIDFGFTNKDTLVSGAKWDTDTADILGDLKRWRRSVIQKTGQAPTVCIMASDVYDTFKINDKVKDGFNLLNMVPGKIEPRVIDPALTFLGRLIELDLDIYTYDEWFIDDEGNEKPMIPAGTVLLLPEEIGSFEFGAVTQLENDNFVTYEAEIVPKMWSDNQNEVKMLRMTSRPLPRPFDVDSWYVAKVK